MARVMVLPKARILAILVSLLLLIGTLASCGTKIAAPHENYENTIMSTLERELAEIKADNESDQKTKNLIFRIVACLSTTEESIDRCNKRLSEIESGVKKAKTFQYIAKGLATIGSVSTLGALMGDSEGVATVGSIIATIGSLSALGGEYITGLSHPHSRNWEESYRKLTEYEVRLSQIKGELNWWNRSLIRALKNGEGIDETSVSTIEALIVDANDINSKIPGELANILTNLDKYMEYIASSIEGMATPNEAEM